MIGSGQVGPKGGISITPLPGTGSAHQVSGDGTGTEEGHTTGVDDESIAVAVLAALEDTGRVVATEETARGASAAISRIASGRSTFVAKPAGIEGNKFKIVSITKMALTVRVANFTNADGAAELLDELLEMAAGRDVVIILTSDPDEELVSKLTDLAALLKGRGEITPQQGVELVWPGVPVAQSISLLSDDGASMLMMGKGARIKAARRAKEEKRSPVNQANALWRSEDESKFGRQGFGMTPFSPFHHTTRYILRALGELRNQWSRLHPDIPFSVVEVGSNTGYFAEFLADRGFPVTATDIKKIPPWPIVVPWLEADARHLPFDDASISAMVSVTSWEYVGPQVIDEAARVLAPGGVFVANSHFWGGDVSRMVVTGGLMAMRTLHLQDNGDSAASRAQEYEHMKADIKNSRIQPIWLLNLMFRRTFRKFADAAYAGKLTGQVRRDVEMLALAGEGLGWIVGDGKDMNSGMQIEQIGDLFTQRGFEVEHIGPLPMRLGGIVPRLWEDRLLGIRARRLGPK